MKTNCLFLPGWAMGALALVAGCNAPGDGPIDEDGLTQRASTPNWELTGAMFASTSYSGYDEANDVVVTPSGTVLVAGYENGRSGVSSVEPGGDASGVIHSYSDGPLGLARNASSFRLGQGNGTTEVIEALALAPVGTDIYVAGRTTGAVSSNIAGCGQVANAGQYDMFYGWLTSASTNASRCFLQQGTNRPQHPRRISVSSANELVIAGYDDIYVPSNYVEAWENPFLTRARRTGNSLQQETGWPLIYDTSTSDVLHGMASGTDAGSPAYVTTSTQSGTARGVAIHKVMPDKSVAWTYVVSRIGYDLGGALHQLPDGDILFVGTTYGLLGDVSYGEQDVVLLRLSPNNELRWIRQYGSGASDVATDLAVDSDGSIYILGETLGSFDPGIINDGSHADVFVLRVNSNGDDMVAFQLDSPGDEKANAIAVGPNKLVYVAGSTTVGLFNATFRGQRDAFLFRVRAPQIIGPF